MALQVILLEPIKRLGQVGDVVQVKNGYARNFLIPQKKAVRATKDNVAYFEAKRKDIEKENAGKIAEAEKLAKQIDGAIITLVQQAGEDGRLYGSVKAADIAKALETEKKASVDRKQVVLHTPIKYIGVHTVEVHLHGDVSAVVHPNIARSATEAKDAKARFEKGEVVMEGGDAGQPEETQEEVAPAEAAEEKEPKKAKAEEEKADAAAEDSQEEAKKPAKKAAKAKKAEPKEADAKEEETAADAGDAEKDADAKKD